MSSVSITFLGAAGTVTGSRFLLSKGNTKVLVDAGLFQGIKELRLRNWEEFEVDPADLSAILLTHAHLDHCGYLPKLVKAGFRGKVFLTNFTAKLADIILRDSARIQVEDAKYAAKRVFPNTIHLLPYTTKPTPRRPSSIFTRLISEPGFRLPRRPSSLFTQRDTFSVQHFWKLSSLGRDLYFPEI